MKKIIKIFSLIVVFSILVSCTTMKKVKNVFKEQTKYTNIVATFVTTQGNINFFLYPEAAPITVANFINLAKRGFYDNTKFIRLIDNFIIQGGDPTNTGMGGPGYTIDDEIVDWLDFYQAGMLGMANAGPKTGGSQFFFTFYPADELNGLHTVFGEIKSDNDFNRMRKLEVGDVIKEIKFEGDVDLILSLNKNLVDNWNKVLDEKFPNLKKYPVKEATPEQRAAYEAELERIFTTQKEKNENSFEYPTTKAIRKIFNTIGGYEDRAPVISE